MDHQIIALVVFIAAYAFFILFPNRRSLTAMSAVVLLLLFGILDPLEAFKEGVNWNVMGIFVGMLVLAEAFMASRFPAYLAERIVNHAPNTAFAILFICAMTSFLSAFVENVATVLIVAPVALSLAKKLKINPVNMMIAIAISSNLQGCATLIGDPPSMLLGGFAKMTFMDFFFYHGKPGIFFAVQLGAVTSVIYLYFVFRGHKEKTEIIAVETVQSWIPTVLLVLLIVALAASSFFDKGFSFLAGAICMAFAFVTLIWQRVNHKIPFWENLKKLDWDTSFFLLGVFIIVESLTQTGWIARISEALSQQVGGNLFLGYALLVLMSIVVSGFVDNVPYLAAMLPVALQMSEKMNFHPALFMFGLLIGASLGGNLTPIGASANIVACGILKKEGHPVSFRQFMKISVPFTFIAVLPAAALVWFFWS
ncbi:MAG: TRAP transporter large permease subunit [Candidatus Hydrogenedentes bacterium]|jgi:Na+/H+ antiporter NhaD/arsenite permease-like protein|nr:TRAP transporter large permease subunit [Candidatus Hydrogenedentota bacterium]